MIYEKNAYWEKSQNRNIAFRLDPIDEKVQFQIKPLQHAEHMS